MKKKIAALLTAALVMTMSTATVFAAESPSKEEDATLVCGGVSGAEEVVVTKTTLDASKQQTAGTKLEDVLESKGNVTSHEAVACIEITGTVTSEKGATVTVSVPGISAGDAVIVLHYVNGAWKEEAASVDADGNVVITGIKSFSPFMFVKYTAKMGSWYYDPAIDGPQETPVSPKTGVVIPVAAMTAGICLAGAAVCGKKVKFN